MKFLNWQKAGVDFGDGIVRLHPALRTVRDPGLNLKKKLFFIRRYIDWFYEGNIDGLEVIKIYSQEEWNKRSENFFKACDKYFEKHPWPEGKYIASISIFNCNPRFLETKTFQVFWKHPRGFVSVAAHEMLHFLFYDYVDKNFLNRKLSEEKLWQLSEVINFFLFMEPEFMGITHDPNPGLYPQLTDMAEGLREQWNKSRSAVKFIKAVL